MKYENGFDKWLIRARDTSLVSVLVFIVLALLGISTFTHSIYNLVTIAGEAYSEETNAVSYDYQTKEALIEAARLVDRFFISIENAKDVHEITKEYDNYIEIKASLNSLLLRNEIRALNDESVEAIRALSGQWGLVERIFKSYPKKDMKDMNIISQKIMHAAFRTALQLEESKKQPPNK